MKFLNITKNGIENVVDEAMYESIYKPAGWKIAGENPARQKEFNSPTDETVKKNVNRMRRKTPEKFNDNLIKDNDDGKL